MLFRSGADDLRGHGTHLVLAKYGVFGLRRISGAALGRRILRRSTHGRDRKSVVYGKSVDLGGRRFLQ